MAGGRPELTKEFLDEKAEALLKWSLSPKATALCQFCVEQEIGHSTFYDWLNKSPKFSEAMAIVKMRIAKNLRDKIQDGYNERLFGREIGSHDYFLRDHEREEKAHEASLKEKTQEQINERVIISHDSLMSLLSSLQSSRKKEAININNEQKS